MTVAAAAWQPRTLGPGAILLCAAIALLTAILLPVSPLVAALPVALAAMLVPLLRRPRLAAAVVLFAVPLVSGMPRGEIVPVLRPNELVLIFVFAAYLLAYFLGPKQRIETTFVDRAFLLFLLARSVLPFIAHPLSALADPVHLLKFFLAPLQYYLLYRLILGTVRRRADLYLPLRAMLASAVVVAVVGLLQALRLPLVEDLLQRYYPSDKLVYTFLHSQRVTSLFAGGWNVCGFYLSQVLLLAIALHPFERPGLPRALLAGAAVLVTLVMGLSFSFTTVITLAIALVYLSRRRGRLRRYLWRALPVIAGVVVLIAVFFGGALRERLSLQFGGSLVPLTFLARLAFWAEVAWPRIAPHLWLGIGPSEFNWITAESEYVFLIATCGLVGLLGFVIFAAYVWRRLQDLARRLEVNTLEGTLVVLGATLFLQSLIASTTGHYFEYSGASETLWAVWALAVAGARIARAEAEGATQADGAAEAPVPGRGEATTSGD